jgi:ubiquinone/menaquinone biosynthesis C-methylase UbiE
VTHPPQEFTEAEIQVLIVLIELEEPKETPNNNFYTFYPQSIEAAAAYFKGFREDWTPAYPLLLEKQLICPAEDGYRLTPAGQLQARRLRDLRPPIYYWYRQYYSTAPHSPAYARFCTALYGLPLCQTNFSDMQQLNVLLSLAELNPASRVLDLGCGAGLIAEYLSDRSGAHVTGLDYSSEAIELARQRTAGKSTRLVFQVGNMDELCLPPASFDTLVSIDTLYMPNDLEATLGHLAQALVPGGQMLVFYTHALWGNPAAPRSDLLPENTPLGRALSHLGLRFNSRDFSAQTHDHLQKKYRLGQQMRAEFEAEANSLLSALLSLRKAVAVHAGGP